MAWLIIPFWIIILISGFILGHPKVKGLIGERRIRKQLSKLPREDFRVLNNLLIKGKIGTIQIDHIVVSSQGVFVIETKNYKGWIHGSENSEYWTQTIYRSKNKFYNPIKQNWGHIQGLRVILSSYPDIPYFPIIVFVGTAKLKNLDLQTDVIYPDKLFDAITKQRDRRKMRDADLDRIFDTLKNACIEDRQIAKNHVSRTKWNVKIKRMKEKIMVCPKCGGKLVKRTGRHGDFYGCANFPQCKYWLKTDVSQRLEAQN